MPSLGLNGREPKYRTKLDLDLDTEFEQLLESGSDCIWCLIPETRRKPQLDLHVNLAPSYTHPSTQHPFASHNGIAVDRTHGTRRRYKRPTYCLYGYLDR